MKMADGILCKYCGWQETDHEVRMPPGGNRRIKGRKHKLANCPGYYPVDEALAIELEEEAIKERENQTMHRLGIKDHFGE